jgi:hypothetical protein
MGWLDLLALILQSLSSNGLFCVHSLLCKRVLSPWQLCVSEPLPSNGRLFWPLFRLSAVMSQYSDVTPESRNNEVRRNRPRLGNGSINTYPRQWIDAQQQMKFLESVFSMWSVPMLYKETSTGPPCSWGINTGTWSSRLRKYRIWDSNILSWVPRDSDPRMTALARSSSNCKRQTRPLVRKGAPHQQTRNCLRVTKIWSWNPRWGLTSRQTGRLTVGRNVTMTSTLRCIVLKEEFSITCYTCDTYTWQRRSLFIKRPTHPLLRHDIT